MAWLIFLGGTTVGFCAGVFWVSLAAHSDSNDVDFEEDEHEQGV